ncbi:MAG TPA: sigma-70 family RNA polymerase sigma factor [Planctomycetaceae bacterium]|nr:sigma-70 family RNA polymerase sigma factor [Planctomycetaceae bacterium]
MVEEPCDVAELLERAGRGDQDALTDLFSRYRDRLKRVVRLRLNRRLLGRVDDSDVLQDVYLDVARQLPQYLRERPIPFFLWLRKLTGQQLVNVHRKHLGAGKRERAREISLYQGAMPPANSVSLAAQLLGRLTSPSQAAIKAEMRLRLQEALNSMQAMDREVLTLRHFEQLSNAEAAHVLGIDESAASKRYLRALERLSRILSKLRLIDHD